jgi:hypothetical protein
MTTKFISLATAIVMLDVYLQSQLSSSDPLFSFVSNNFAVNACLLIIVGLMVAVSFKSKFSRWWTFAGIAGLSLIFGIIGVIGVFFSDLLYSFPQVLLPLDYMFLLEAAVVFGICSLSYQHQAIPYKYRVSLPRSAAQFAKLVFPVPKIPHSPNSLSRHYGIRKTA